MSNSLAGAFVGLTSAAGALGARLAVRNFPRQYGISELGMRGWLFVPSALLLVLQQSRWAVLATAVAAALTSSQLGELEEVNGPQECKALAETNPLPSLSGLPSLPKWPIWTAVSIALCLRLCPIGLGTGRVLGAAFLATAGAAMLFFQRARWSRTSHLGGSRERSGRSLWRCGLVAVCATTLALLPTLRGTLGDSEWQTSQELIALLRASLAHGNTQVQLRNGEGGFRGVILWPLLDRSKAVPLLSTPHLTSAQSRAEVIIPFRGPYLYFKPWMSSPGPQAHVAEGSPLQISVRSSTGTPLRMEARQDLADPVPLSCCRELEVAIEDQEHTSSPATIGLMLTDESTPGEPSQFLGTTQTSLPDGSNALSGAGQAHQVLHFPIALPLRIARFTRITVLLFPLPGRETEGRHIAIEHFVLVPR